MLTVLHDDAITSVLLRVDRVRVLKAVRKCSHQLNRLISAEHFKDAWIEANDRRFCNTKAALGGLVVDVGRLPEWLPLHYAQSAFVYKLEWVIRPARV